MNDTNANTNTNTTELNHINVNSVYSTHSPILFQTSTSNLFSEESMFVNQLINNNNHQIHEIHLNENDNNDDDEDESEEDDEEENGDVNEDEEEDEDEEHDEVSDCLSDYYVICVIIS